jgi:hypothetical protein
MKCTISEIYRAIFVVLRLSSEGSFYVRRFIMLASYDWVGNEGGGHSTCKANPARGCLSLQLEVIECLPDFVYPGALTLNRNLTFRR